MQRSILFLTAIGLLLTATAIRAEDSQQSSETVSREKLFKHFEETLSGVKFVGRFTILGKDDAPPKKEEYTIISVKKLPDGDYWLFNAKVNNVTLPLPLEVKWAGNTPIISLTDFTIPAMGTFSARVVIYNKKYAGTWKHGEASGHLFGVIEKSEAADAE